MLTPISDNERMQYLECMGIDQYVPRFELAQSQPSVLLHAQEFNRKTHTEKQNELTSNTQLPESIAIDASGLSKGPASAKIDLANILDDASALETTGNHALDKRPQGAKFQNTGSQEKEPLSETGRANTNASHNPLSQAFIDETEAKIDVAEKALRSLSDILNTPKKQTALAFSLSIWRLDNDMMIIDSRRPKQAMPTTALLGRILKYYGLRTQTTEPEIIQWPVQGAPNLPVGKTGEAGEKAMIMAFLESRIETQQVKGLWLMGKAAYTHIALCQDQGQDQELELPFDEVVGASVNLTDKKIPSIVLPSLTDMLIEPMNKRMTWVSLNRYLNDGRMV